MKLIFLTLTVITVCDVSSSDISGIKCDVNEIPTDCINPCPRGAQCFAPCIPGCICKPGYVRKDEKCVKDDCIKCGENEISTDCINPCPPDTECFAPCIPGCICEDGYVRNGTKCVKNECGENEVYSDSAITCPPQTCASIYTLYKCPPYVPKAGCNCIENYLRNSSGICIPSEDCPPQPCGENEEYTKCGTACPKTCDNYKDTCNLACTDQCVAGCFCKPGLVRDANGNCISPKKCPIPVCKGKHEHYDLCPPTCPATDGCSLLWSKFNCTNAPKCCTPKCRCDKGYYRKGDKGCVKGSECTNSNPTE